MAQTPLHFEPGSYGLLVNGVIGPNHAAREYAIDGVRAGQTMIVTFTGAGPMKGGVRCNGGGDGPYDGTGNTFVVPKSGQCVVYVGPNMMAEPVWAGGFTLSVLLAKP